MKLFTVCLMSFIVGCGLAQLVVIGRRIIQISAEIRRLDQEIQRKWKQP